MLCDTLVASILERERERAQNSLEEAASTMAQESISDVQLVDDFYFSALSNEKEDQLCPISDSKFAEELQFQEALMSSIFASQIPNNPPPSPPIQTTPSSEPEPITTAESGESSQCFCEICAENKPSEEMFKIDACSHSYCSACIAKYVTVKIRESAPVVPIACPESNCGGKLEFAAFRPVMPAEVAAASAWADFLCEAAIAAEEKFYCPFRDCSAMLLNDIAAGGGGGGGGEGIRECECPYCHRLFCVRCYVPWHAGIGCEEYGRLGADERGREDLMVRELARSQRWMRCPHCKFYVEKTQGCLHMTCRCGFQFCYACGATWSQTHGGCQP